MIQLFYLTFMLFYQCLTILSCTYIYISLYASCPYSCIVITRTMVYTTWMYYDLSCPQQLYMIHVHSIHKACQTTMQWPPKQEIKPPQNSEIVLGSQPVSYITSTANAELQLLHMSSGTHIVMASYSVNINYKTFITGKKKTEDKYTKLWKYDFYFPTIQFLYAAFCEKKKSA